MTAHRAFSTTLLVIILLVSCRPKPAAAPTPAPPPPAAPAPPAPAPVITLRAEPGTIERGQSTTLRWEARNATTVRIEPALGDVGMSGNRQVSPASSVTYTATATGTGGTASDTARITVTVPPAPPATDAPPRAPNVRIEDLFAERVRTIYFDYDQADIRSDQTEILRANAQWLRDNPSVRFTIDGHCDERGSQEYNIGLGDRRANVVREFLKAQGVAENRISVASYGEERPVCTDETEDCFQRNRRAEFKIVP